MFKKIGYYLLSLALIGVFMYTAVNSNVGTTPDLEQVTSIVTMAAVTILFLMKKFEIKLLYIIGVYSFEIYLLHWPILYHYDFVFKFLPAWLAMAAYLAIFIGLGWCLQKLSGIISERVFKQ